MMVIERFGMAAFACVFNRDFSKVLMIKRNEEKRKKYGFDWALPGGKIELGEYSLDAIRREIKEEIGLDISKEQIKLARVVEDPKWFNVAHAAFFMYVGFTDEDVEIKLNAESDEFGWFSLDSLPEHRVGDNLVEYRNIAVKEFS